MDPIQVTSNATLFTSECSVTALIRSNAETVWGLLANAEQQSSWNSTLTFIEGTVEDGGTIRLKAKVAGDRLFTLKVSDVHPERSMVWSDGMAPLFRGVRTFTLTPVSEGVQFTMTERMAGMMMPMMRLMLPDFTPVFEAYARDLTERAESTQPA